MATAEPTRADDAEPGPESGPRIRLPETDGRRPGAGTPEAPSPAPASTTPATGPTSSSAALDAPARVSRPKAVVLAVRARMLRHPVLSVTALAGALHIVWFFTFANSGGDLAAQDAWAEFVGRHPDSAYNMAWYGGMHAVSYSMVSPYLMAVLGVRTTMMLAGTVSAALLTMLLIRSLPPSRLRSSGGTPIVRNPLWAALAGVFGLLGNAASGRVTFGLGMMFGLAAVAVVFCWPYRWRYKRWAKALCAAPLAALATMSSPVAGLFVGLVAVALFLQKRRPGAWALGLGPTAVVAVSAWMFPFSGTQPMGFGSVVLPLVFSVLVCVLVPREWITVRITAAVYGLGVVLVWLVSSQIGSNMTRLSMLFAGVALVAALPFTVPRSRKWYAIVVAFVGFVGWIGFKSVDDVVNTTPAASWARELAPLVNELQEVGADKGRVEVVPARSHREASALAPYVNLARGWNRQADMERNPLFYDDTLNSANYHEWLKRWAVHFVVLPKDTPDGDGGERERELVQRGLPYLQQIWGDANWQLFAVRDPSSLAEPNAVVERASQSEMTMRVEKAGRVVVRIPYSPWLSIVDAEGNKLEGPQETEESRNRSDDDGDGDSDGGPKTYDNLNGCLMETEEDENGDKWTVLLAPEPGTYRLAAPYGVPRGTPCPEELH